MKTIMKTILLSLLAITLILAAGGGIGFLVAKY